MHGFGAMALRAFLALAALSSLLVTGAEAGAPTTTLQATFAQANKIIADPTLEDRPLERLVAIRALFSKVFDFRGASEDVLGPEWKARTAVEQREFTSIFSGFVQRSFVYWLAAVAEIDANGITVYYLGESVERDRAGCAPPSWARAAGRSASTTGWSTRAIAGWCATSRSTGSA